MKRIIAILIIIAGTAHAQTFAPTPVAGTNYLTAPVGTVIQYGCAAKWVTLTITKAMIPLYIAPVPPLSDPCPGQAKSIQVQQTASAQLLSYQVSEGGPVIPLTIPALAVVVVTPPVPPVAPPAAGTTVNLTCTVPISITTPPTGNPVTVIGTFTCTEVTP